MAELLMGMKLAKTAMNIGVATLTFGLPFAAVLSYFLCYDEYEVNVLTSILISVGVGLATMIGSLTSKYIRCTMVLFVPQLFAEFGLLMLFAFTSWITSSAPLHLMLENITTFNILVGIKFPFSSTEEGFASLIAKVASIGGVMHQLILIPLLMAFIQCFVFVFMEVSSGVEACPTPLPNNGMTIRKFVKACYRFVRNWLCGCLFGMTILTFVLEFFTFEILSTILDIVPIAETERKSIKHSFFGGWLIFYITFTAIVILISPFAKTIKQIQKGIVRWFFVERFQNVVPVRMIPLLPVNIPTRMEEVVERPAIVESPPSRWTNFLNTPMRMNERTKSAETIEPRSSTGAESMEFRI